MNDNITLYSPGEAPFLGMVSSQDPAGLPKGYWRNVVNWRGSRNSMQGRLGCDELTSGVIVASASFRGAWNGRLDGTEYLYVALRVGGATTRIYSINLSSWAATEVSASGSGTRFSTDGDVVFAPYRELGIGDGTNEGKDCLYISNGTADIPRCTKSGSSVLDFLYNFDISTLDAGTFRPIPAGYVFVNDPALITATASDADVTVAETGSAPLCQVYVTVGTATDVGDYSNIAFGTNSCVNIFGNTETTGDTLDLSKSRQLWLLMYDSVADPIHNYANLEVTQSASQVQIYDAQGANRVDPSIVPVGGGYYLVGYNLEASVAATLTAVSGVRHEFARLFGASRTFRVAGIMAGGRVPQGTIYEMAYATMYSRVESGGIVLGSQPTAAVSEYGASRDLGYKLPDSEGFWYQYRIDWGGTVPTGCDATFLYRMEPGDTRAKFVADMGVSNNPFNDNVRREDRADFRYAPSPGSRGPVSGRCAESANDRLMVGGINGGSSQVWFSDETFPLRFRAVPTDNDGDGYPDPGSGTSKSFPGEDVYAIKKMPGSLSGRSPSIVFTSASTYRFDGSTSQALGRPTLVNTHGTIYSRSVVSHRNYLFYMDIDFVARRLSGGIQADDLSTGIVDDQFESGDLTKICAGMWKERINFAYRASGASLNQQVSLWDSTELKWVNDSYTTAAQNWLQFATVGSGSTRKFIAFTEEGRIYHIEKAGQTTDDGTAISGTLTTGELHDDMWSQRVWGSLGVITDSISGATWTVTRLDEQDQSLTGSGTGTINVGASTTRTYRYEKSSGTNLVQSGIRTAAARLTITGPVQNGKYLKSMILTVSKGTSVPKGDRT